MAASPTRWCAANPNPTLTLTLALTLTLTLPLNPNPNPKPNSNPKPWQEPTLFVGTVAENIQMGLPGATHSPSEGLTLTLIRG